MSGVFGNPWLYNANPPFYNYLINQSLRFEDGDTASMSRTNSSAGNRRTWTFSAWVKVANIGSGTQNYMLGATTDNYNVNWAIFFFGSDELTFYSYTSSQQYQINTGDDGVFRDPSAWYHLVLAWDTTQSTAADRIKLYVNGSQFTNFETAVYPSLNYEEGYINNNIQQDIGRAATAAYGYDGYMAEVHFVDGSALSPTSFGETKSGIWIPKKYTGSHGTNGYHLDFADGSALGDDESGNNNDFTPTGLAATDVVLDSPTNNFAVMSSIHPSSSNFTISEGNLAVTKSGTGTLGLYSQSIMPLTGKWYFEVCITGRGTSDRTRVGVANYDSVTATSTIQSSYSGVEIATGLNRIIITEASSVTEVDGFFTALSDNDIVRFAVDMDNGRLYVGVNGNWWNYNSSQTGGNPASGSGYLTNSTTIFNGSPMTAYSGFSAGATTSSGQVFNFGQDSSFANNKTSGSAGASDANGVGDFFYAVPSGFLALASSNLPEPSIIDSTKHFNTVLWTGDGNDGRSITGVGFNPAFVWIKSRNLTTSHLLNDKVRGANKSLFSELDVVETADNGGGYLSAFVNDGFSVTSGASGDDAVNDGSDTYVAWNWKAGGATPTKTYKVVVVSDSGNKYRFRNSADTTTYAASAVTLDLQEGGTYTFDQSDSSNSGHPFRFSTTSNGTHGGGSEYTTGVTTTGTAGSAGAKTTIIVAAGAPTLYYYCTAHSGMGGQVNTNSTYGSTNFDGTLIATVSANVEAGFSIAAWTGNNVDNTVIPHGLGGAADLVITKSRATVTSPWLALHSFIASETNNVIILNQITAATNGSSTLSYGNPDELTSVGVKLVRGTTSTMNYVNATGNTYIAYFFKNVDGYLKCGGYTGNGASDGVFIYTGFRVSLWMMRAVTDASHWVIYDAAREPENAVDVQLLANEVNAEYASGRNVDFLSNGVKLRFSTYLNVSGKKYIYVAIGNSSKYANAR